LLGWFAATSSFVNAKKHENVLTAGTSVLADHNQFDEFEKLYGAECVECGSCSFICPAKRNLAQSMKTGRKQVLANRRKK
jgi:electron transport complex protein RnfC